MSKEVVVLPTLMLPGNIVPIDDSIPLGDLSRMVPYEYIIQWIKERTSATGMINRVLILKSETASGKSTLLPPKFYEKFIKGFSRGLICTQPRIATTIENVMEMLKFMNLVLGKDIGWSTKQNKVRSIRSGILSATIGILVQHLKIMSDEELMDRYMFIIIDETHERDLNTDICIYYLKKLLTRQENNAKCPFVIFMSATFDPMPFVTYFGLNYKKNFIHVRGASAPIHEQWDWRLKRGPVTNYIGSLMENIRYIIVHGTNDIFGKGDILIFLPGAYEMLQLKIQLVKYNEELMGAGIAPLSIILINRENVAMRNKDYRYLVEIPLELHTVGENKVAPQRRIILSTNVLETGITIHSLKYVIDSGFNREVEYNSVMGVVCTLTKPASQSQIIQRRGRVGRKFSGIYYPLYTKDTFQKLQKNQLSQIVTERSDLVLLNVICDQIQKKRTGNMQFYVSYIDMLDNPPISAINEMINKFYTLGIFGYPCATWDNYDLASGLTSDGYNAFGVTKLGILTYQLNGVLPIEAIRMILAGFYWKYSILDLITIAVFVYLDLANYRSFSIKRNTAVKWDDIYKQSLPHIFTDDQAVKKIQLLIYDHFINGLFLYTAISNILILNEKNPLISLHRWCLAIGIPYDFIMEFIRIRDEFITQAINIGLHISFGSEYSFDGITHQTFNDTITKIKHCIYDGYRNNLATYNPDTNKYTNNRGLTILKPFLLMIHKNSILPDESIKLLPRYVIYDYIRLKLDKNNNNYKIAMNNISIMDGFVSIDPLFTA